jgi:peptidyl-prolyl cis-trans isomerase A (cyclophilin A)
MKNVTVFVLCLVFALLAFSVGSPLEEKAYGWKLPKKGCAAEVFSGVEGRRCSPRAEAVLKLLSSETEDVMLVAWRHWGRGGVEALLYYSNIDIRDKDVRSARVRALLDRDCNLVSATPIKNSDEMMKIIMDDIWLECACDYPYGIRANGKHCGSAPNPNKNTSADSGGKRERRKPMVLISTSLGDIKLELYEEQAPITVANFLSYVEEGFFDGTIFHRVINNFMIQGGGITADMKQKPTKASIKNEADNGLKNERGTIAMARTADVDSATSQFFINHRDNSFLDHGARDFGYAVFGKVVEGIEVVDKIAAVQTRPGDVPVETVSILSMKVVN